MRSLEKRKRSIRRLMYKVRRAVEALAEYEEGERLLGGNCPVSLSGYCGRASAMLSFELSECGIEHSIVYSDWGHIFVQWNGYVLDVTATQFGDFFGVTMIRERDSIEALCDDNSTKSTMHYWDCTKIFESIEHLRAWQEDERWPDEQTAWQDDLQFL